MIMDRHWLRKITEFTGFLIIFLTANVKGSCITYDDDFEGSNLIFDEFSTSTCKHLENGDRESVKIITLQIHPACVHTTSVELDVLLSGQSDCSQLEFLFVHYDDPPCSRKNRCVGENLSQGADSTLCLIRCPKKLNSTQNGYEIEIVHRFRPNSWDLCGLRMHADCHHYKYIPASVGVANRCVSTDNSGSISYLAEHTDVTLEECMQKACVCEGCSNNAAVANTFNYRISENGRGFCYLRNCESTLNIIPHSPGYNIYVKTGFLSLTETCNSSPCQNGGTCLDTMSGYSCECTQNYGGYNCEKDCQYNLHTPSADGKTNQCISVNNSDSTNWLVKHTGVTLEQCRRKACVCEGCSNNGTTGNTFNYLTSNSYCWVRQCESTLNIVNHNNGLDIYTLAGFP